MKKRIIPIFILSSAFLFIQALSAGESVPKPLGIKSVYTDRIRYLRDYNATFEVTIQNKTNTLWNGKVTAVIETGHSTKTNLDTKPLTLGAGEEVILRWRHVIKLPDFGHALHVTMTGADGSVVDEAREVFCVGEDYYNLGNYTTSFIHYEYTDTQKVREGRPMKAARDRYITVCEHFSTSPGNWGCLIPDRESWLSGQNNYKETLIGEKNHIQAMQKAGVAMILYNINFSSGAPGLELMRRHPEYYGFSETGRQMEGINLTSPAAQQKTIDDVVACLMFYNYDGIRWDGIEAHDSYNYKGERVKDFKNDDFNAEWHEKMERGIKERLPRAGVHYNFGNLVLDANKLWTKTYHTLGPGAYLLWESMRGLWKDPNHPYNKWENFVEAVRCASEDARKEGNFQHFGWYGCENIAQRTHTQAIYFALGGNWDTWYLCAYDAAGMRFGKYIRDVRLRLVDEPEGIIKVEDPEGRLWWKRFVTRLDEEGLIMTHLLNKPLLEYQDDKSTAAPPIRSNIKVSMKKPGDKEIVSATWIDMDSDDRNWIHPLKTEKEGDYVTVTVPRVAFWSFVIWEVK